MNLICSKSLGACALCKWCCESHPKTQEASLSDHYAVVDTKPFVSSEKLTSALTSHYSHHLLKTLVATNTSNDEYLFAADVSHRTFRDFNEHCEDGLLQRKKHRSAGVIIS